MISGMFFKSVIQQILLFGAETWVVTPTDGKSVERVHSRGGKETDRTATAESS